MFKRPQKHTPNVCVSIHIYLVASVTLCKYFQADIQKSIPHSLELFHPSSYKD